MSNLASSVISLTTSSSNLFFGDSGHGIARYDVVKYPTLKTIDEKMKSFFWRPVEIDMSQEKQSFEKMTEVEQFVFTSNLRRQILLDTLQGRSPSMTFLPYCTDPILENCILTWSFFESIHSEAYTHIIRAIYPDPSSVFEEIPNIPEIVQCSDSISGVYNAFINSPTKENLYLALIAANALEALRFYVSFACTFSFAERGLVEASAKSVKLILRDEALHLALVQNILKILPKDDPDFAQIIGDNRNRAIDIYEATAEQEKSWAKYLFQHGTIMGLNEKILCQFIDYLLPRRKFSAGISTYRAQGEHPLPWFSKWERNDNVQVAPQEVELSSYLVGTVQNDLLDTTFSLEL